MKTISTQEQRDAVRKLIQTELLKRGYTAEITHFEETESRRSGQLIEMSSEYFQTVPVMFEKIRVESFSTSVTRKDHVRDDGEVIPLVHFWICVHVSYQHFSGGSNGCKLFDFTADFVEGSNYVSGYTIR